MGPFWQSISAFANLRHSSGVVGIVAVSLWLGMGSALPQPQANGFEPILPDISTSSDMVCEREAALKLLTVEKLVETLVAQAAYPPLERIEGPEDWQIVKYDIPVIVISWAGGRNVLKMAKPSEVNGQPFVNPFGGERQEFIEEIAKERIEKSVKELSDILSIQFEIIPPFEARNSEAPFASRFPNLAFTFNDNVGGGDILDRSGKFNVLAYTWKIQAHNGLGTVYYDRNFRRQPSPGWRDASFVKIDKPVRAIPELKVGMKLAGIDGSQWGGGVLRTDYALRELFGEAGRLFMDVSIQFYDELSPEKYAFAARRAVLLALLGQGFHLPPETPLCYMAKVLYGSGVRSGASRTEAREAFLQYINNDRL